MRTETAPPGVPRTLRPRCTFVTPDPADDFVHPDFAREHVNVLPGWKRDALAFRTSVGTRAEIDVAYGPRQRQRLDLFVPARGTDGPVAMFIHGGYWQSMHRLSFSHMARGPLAHGVTVAVVGYTLCPEVSLDALLTELRDAVAWLSRRTHRPVTVYGHSAGGHLAACLFATDWRAVHPDLAPDVVPAALCVSGIYSLDGLLRTPLNQRLGLDQDSARRLSPLSVSAPAGSSASVWVGEREPPEFHRQADAYATHLASHGVRTARVTAPGDTHFSVIAPLAEPGSVITQALVALARAPDESPMRLAFPSSQSLR